MNLTKANQLFPVDLHAMPLDEARKVYFEEMERAREDGYGGLLLNHGFKSGTAIRDSLRKTAVSQKRKGKIKTVLFGERFGPFTESGRVAEDVTKETDSCPWVRSHREWGNNNAGITIIVF